MHFGHIAKAPCAGAVHEPPERIFQSTRLNACMHLAEFGLWAICMWPYGQGRKPPSMPLQRRASLSPGL